MRSCACCASGSRPATAWSESTSWRARSRPPSSTWWSGRTGGNSRSCASPTARASRAGRSRWVRGHVVAVLVRRTPPGATVVVDRHDGMPDAILRREVEVRRCLAPDVRPARETYGRGALPARDVGLEEPRGESPVQLRVVAGVLAGDGDRDHGRVDAARALNRLVSTRSPGVERSSASTSSGMSATRSIRVPEPVRAKRRMASGSSLS